MSGPEASPIRWVRARRILTGDPALPVARSLAVRAARIVEVRADDPPGGAAAVAHDFPDATLLPGLMDSHVHLSETAFASAVPSATGLTEARVLAEHLRRWAREEPGDDLLWVGGYDGESWGDGREGLSPEAMDEATGGRPVYMLHRTGHCAYLSASALRRLGVPLDSPDLVRREGAITGQLVGPTFMQLDTRLRTGEGFLRRALAALPDTLRALRRAGLTGICALEEGGSARALLSRAQPLPLRVQVFWQTRRPQEVAELGGRRVGGCQTTAMDGDIGPHTMALTSPYADRETTGSLYWEAEELAAFLREAARLNLSVALHALGDAAIDRVLEGYAAVLAGTARHPGPAPWRVDHLEMPRPGQAVRARRLGVGLAIQPGFNRFWPHPTAEPALGRYRSLCYDPLASLVFSGAAVGGGSDSPVTPARPLLGLAAAMGHSNPDERLTWEEALALFTWGNARVMGVAAERGRLAPGYLADFTAVAGDLADPSPETLAGADVVATFIGGEPEGEAPWEP